MKPVRFPESNATLAEDQPEYLDLPIHRSKTHEGTVTSCWFLSWKERFKLLVTGRLWLSAWTFHDLPQPLLPSVHKPEGMK